MAQHAALERQALDQLRRGDLQGARGTLGVLARLRPDDAALSRRLEQVDALIARREEAKARMQAEPLRYAHAYIKAGRLEEGLRLLRAALAKEPDNARLEALALQVARRLRADRAEKTADFDPAQAERRAAEDTLRAQARARQAQRSPSRPPSARRTEERARPAPPRPARPPPPPEVEPTAAASASGPGGPAPALDPEGRLRIWLERVRSRRRAPSRWLGETTSLERR